MSVDLVISSVSNTLQQITDQNGNATSVWVSSPGSPAEKTNFAIYGPGSQGAQVALQLGTYVPATNQYPNVQLVSIDQGNCTANVQFQLSPPMNGTSTPPQTVMQLSANGSIQFPRLPLPSSGYELLAIDSAGNLQPVTLQSSDVIKKLQADIAELKSTLANSRR